MPKPNSLGTLLVATDFSPDANEALSRAILLARQHDAGLVLAHVVDSGPWLALHELLKGEPDLASKLMEQGGMQLAAAAQALEREGKVRSVRTALASGSLVDGLRGVADQADLLVVGVSADHPVRDFTRGSTAEQLARVAGKPILRVRGRAAADYAQVLVAVDFSPASMRALELAMTLAPGARLHLLHCVDLPYAGKMKTAGVEEHVVAAYVARARQQAVDRLREITQALPQALHVTTSVRDGDVRAELLKQRDALGADLISLGKQGQSMVADALLGSVTVSMLDRAPCDVLVAPGPAPQH
jgi:nucleotide-binding universal stress UspA family protein